MKYNCPFCNIKMSYYSEIQYFDSTIDNSLISYFVNECKKCSIGVIPKYKIWDYKEQVQGLSIILDNCLTTYKIVSRYDLIKTSLSKVEELVSQNGAIGCSFNRIIEINEVIKIDLADPINSGLQAIDRLMKLRAFS